MSEIIKCPYCSEEVQKDAKICKHCKKEINLSFSFSRVIGLLFICLLFFWIIFYLEKGININIFNSKKTLNNIERQVAEDFEDQYRIALLNGSDLDVCVAAWMVKAAYLQANNNESYAKWVEIEKLDCKKAGLEK